MLWSNLNNTQKNELFVKTIAIVKEDSYLQVVIPYLLKVIKEIDHFK